MLKRTISYDLISSKTTNSAIVVWRLAIYGVVLDFLIGNYDYWFVAKQGASGVISVLLTIDSISGMIVGSRSVSISKSIKVFSLWNY